MQNDKIENFEEANEKLRRKLKNVEKIQAKVRKTKYLVEKKYKFKALQSAVKKNEEQSKEIQV